MSETNRWHDHPEAEEIPFHTLERGSWLRIRPEARDETENARQDALKVLRFAPTNTRGGLRP